jgi:hypothetical protein
MPGSNVAAVNPTRLRWSMRHYWWAALVAMLVGLAVAVATLELGRTTPDHPFRATSLVVARELIIEPEQLPGLASAVFASRSIAEEIIDATGVESTPGGLIPRRVRLEPVESIAARIVGEGESEREAADLADAGAAALVDNLNDAATIGVFVVQDTARTEPLEATSPSILFVVVTGLAAAAVTWVMLLVLVLLRKNPITSGEEASRIAGAPLLTTLRMGEPSGEARSPLEVRGLSAVASHLARGPRTTSVLVASERDTVVLAGTLLADVLSRADGGRPVPMRSLLEQDDAMALAGSTASDDGATHRVMAISLPDLDVPQLVPEGARIALLAVEGQRSDPLAVIADQFTPGELVGVVFVTQTKRARATNVDDGDGRRSRRSSASQADARSV